MQWGNLMSQQYYSSDNTFKDKWQIPNRNKLGPSYITKDVLYELLASHYELSNNISPLPNFEIMYFHILFPKGVRAQCWEATVLFQSSRGNPLGI